MRCFKTAAILLVAFLATGCATGLNSIQQREYNAMQANNVLVEEKDPTAGALLGLLPGGGSFYAREPGYGVINLLLWPLSILWDPISGYEGSKRINYDISKDELNKKKTAEMSALDDKLTAGQIKNPDYVLEKHKIEKKYALE